MKINKETRSKKPIDDLSALQLSIIKDKLIEIETPANILLKSNIILWLYFGNFTYVTFCLRRCYVILITLEIPTL